MNSRHKKSKSCEAPCFFPVQDARHARSDGLRQATCLNYTKPADSSRQCDETQPACRRCVKSQRTCHGMGAGKALFVVHFENPYASGQRKRPRGPRSTPTALLVGTPDPVMQPPLVDLKTRAITYYLHYHLQRFHESTGFSRGVLDDLLPIWRSRAECQMIDLAVSSLALAVFSRAQKYPPTAVEASEKYQQLLRIAQITILSLDEGNVATCLLAIFCMSRYEDTVYYPTRLDSQISSVIKPQSFSHHDGALVILKIWKSQLSDSQPAMDVIKHTRRGIIRSALIRNIALPKWIEEGAAFGESGMELAYDRIIVRTVSVRQRLSALLEETTGTKRTSSEHTSTTRELDQEARYIDDALQDWRAQFPGSWCFQRHTLPEHRPCSTRDFSPQTVHSYSNPAYAAVWNIYYATSMLINSTHLKILNLNRSDSDHPCHKQRAKCLSTINTMACNLASSIPFCLQQFTVTSSPDSSTDEKPITLNTKEDILPSLANLTVWPLTIASSIEGVDFMQRSRFRSQLAHLGRTIGAGVLEYAETEPWLEL